MEREDEEGLSALGNEKKIIDIVEILDDDDDDDIIEITYQPPPVVPDEPKIKQERVESPHVELPQTPPVELPQSPLENEEEKAPDDPPEEKYVPDIPSEDEQTTDNLTKEEQAPDIPSEDLPVTEFPTEVLQEPPLKKKRGKKKKPVVEEVFNPLPEEAITGFPPEVVEELQCAYKILQTIMRISNLQPFLDKPNENLYGLSSYYSIIKKPMWLNEVQRKLLNREYDGIKSFVADIRLILENCYRFWGASHKISRKALFIEHKLELKLLTFLPESMKEKCLEPDLEDNEVFQNEQDENMDEENYENGQDRKHNSKESITATLIKGFESKILHRVLESNDGYDNEDIEEQNKKEEEMLNWEREHLVNEEDRNLIKSMWQLAEIGSFLKLTYVALNVEEITQYEVERMLLMPKESTTLATLMTSMLSPHVLRSQLDFKAVMPYEIWTFRLKKRIDSWFHIFYAKDEFQTFVECGIEPSFWSFINITNPLDNAGFHEIPFIQRVWIFKSLCNNLMHTDKPIQDCFFNNNARELRPICMGRDKRRNIYFRIPFFREIRVYKQAALPETTINTVHDGDFHDEFLTELLDSTNNITFNEEDQGLNFTPSPKDCYMIADSIDALAAYTKQLKDRKQSGIAKNFSNQLKLVKNERKSIDGLIALHTQWHEYQVRSQEYFSHILTLWLNAEKQKRRHVDYFNSGLDDADQNVEVLGKRRSKRNQKVDFLCLRGSDDSDEKSSSDYESSDISDWETTYRNKKKKKSDTKKKKKQASSESDMEDQCNEESNSNLSISGVASMQDDMFEVEEKPNINEISIKIENGNNCIIENSNVNNVIVNNGKEFQPSFNIANNVSEKVQVVSKNSTVSQTASSTYSASPVIKKEKDEVICISSDEEEEKKVIPNRTLVRNGIPTTAPPVAQNVNSIPRRASVPAPINSAPVPTPSPSVPAPIPVPIQTIPAPIPLQPVPQPIPLPPVPQPIPATPPKPRRMPLPIPEPPWPQPMVEPAMPQPIPAPRANSWPTSPRTPSSTPRTPRMVSPRLRSPLSNSVVRTPSPRPSPLRTSVLSPVRQHLRNPAVRNLFPQSNPSVHTVEGVLEIGQKRDGSYGYHVRLPDGGIIDMNRQEIDDIRRKNNGVLPVKLEVPLTKNKKF